MKKDTGMMLVHISSMGDFTLRYNTISGLWTLNFTDMMAEGEYLTSTSINDVLWQAINFECEHVWKSDVNGDYCDKCSIRR